MDESNFPIPMVELPEHKVIELLKINAELREQNEELKKDLATVFITSLFFTSLMEKPFQAIAEFLRVIKNPAKYTQVFKPMNDVLTKHKNLARQIQEEMKKRGIK